jgi:hypothetical protein
MNTLIAAVVARKGGRRWCELAYATGGAAETFLSIFPAAKFVCVYRDWPAIARLAAGNDGPIAPMGGVAKSSRDLRASSPADYWTEITATLIAFEKDHPESCIRVRYEDFQAVPSDVAGRLRSFLGVKPTRGWTLYRSAEEPVRDAEIAPVASERVAGLRGQLGYVPVASTFAAADPEQG